MTSTFRNGRMVHVLSSLWKALELVVRPWHASGEAKPYCGACYRLIASWPLWQVCADGFCIFFLLVSLIGGKG